MSAANTLRTSIQPTDPFERADTDTRLALLWVMAKRLRQISTTAAPAAAFSQVVQGLIRQLHQVKREEQLDVLREMITGDNTRLAEAYSALDANMRLAFWYR
ncbi:MAG: orange carotenoid protein N-terminal domain-containing protein, partial [Leptolyngbya sp.]|nr:orange carotenoid protein N-terminal domain-containing protein [Leptolyngbya sp.]